jgi:hypothetical protein
MMLDPSFYGEPDNPAKKRGGTAATQSPPVKANVALDHCSSNTVQKEKQSNTSSHPWLQPDKPQIPELWHQHRIRFRNGVLRCLDCYHEAPFPYMELISKLASHLQPVPGFENTPHSSPQEFLESRLFFAWTGSDSTITPCVTFHFMQPKSRWITRCLSGGWDRAIAKEKLKLEGGGK